MSVYTEAAATLRIDALSAFYRWYNARTPKVASTALANNKAAFTRAWGPQLCTYTGEYRYYIWKREHLGRVFFALTGARGTSVEALVAPGGRDIPTDEQINAVMDEILAVALSA